MSLEKAIEELIRVGLPPKIEKAFIGILETVRECEKILKRSEAEFVERDEIEAAHDVLMGTKDLMLLLRDHIDGKVTNEEFAEKGEEICKRVEDGEDNWWKEN